MFATQSSSAATPTIRGGQWLSFLTVVAVLALLPSSATAKPDLMDHLAAQAWGELAGRAANDFVDLVGAKASLSAKIALARRDFFRQYPDGPGLEAARKHFDNLLLGKDVMYLSTGCVSGLDEAGEKRLFKQRGSIGISGFGGDIDGGICLLARPAFARLIKAMRTDIKAYNKAKHGSDGVDFGSLTVLPGPFMAALKKNKDAFETYQLARNYDEFLRAGERMAVYDDPRLYTALILRLYRYRTLPEALADYEALKNAMGEKAVNDAARQAAAIPQNRMGKMTDLARLGLSLPAHRPKGDNRPTSKDTKGKTIIPNGSPITVLRALWRRNARGDLLIDIAEDRDLSYTQAWHLLMDLAKALGQKSLQDDDPRTYVMMTLLRNEKISVPEAVAGYQALLQIVGEKQLLDAAGKVAAIPLNGRGSLTDISKLPLVRYGELPKDQTALPSGKSKDGRTGLLAATPQFALRALWCRDNPQAFAVQQIADIQHLNYAQAWRTYQAMEKAVGAKRIEAAANAAYAAPKRGAGDLFFSGLLVTPVPPGTATWMFFPFEKFQAEALAGDDTRAQIRYFIALQTHDAQSIDKMYASLVKLKGEKALLAAAANLRTYHWQTKGDQSVIQTLPDVISGKYDPLAKFRKEQAEAQYHRMLNQRIMQQRAQAKAAAQAAAQAKKAQSNAASNTKQSPTPTVTKPLAGSTAKPKKPRSIVRGDTVMVRQTSGGSPRKAIVTAVSSSTYYVRYLDTHKRERTASDLLTRTDPLPGTYPQGTRLRITVKDVVRDVWVARAVTSPLSPYRGAWSLHYRDDQGRERQVRAGINKAWLDKHIYLDAYQAVRYDKGRIKFTGDAKDVAELEAAARGGNGRACRVLGELIAQGKLAGSDAKALAWFEQGDHLLNSECTAHLAQFVVAGRAVDDNDPRKEPKNLRKLVLTAASSRSPLGIYLLAHCLDKGIGFTASPRRAKRYYIDAAKMGNPQAQQWCKDNHLNY